MIESSLLTASNHFKPRRCSLIPTVAAAAALDHSGGDDTPLPVEADRLLTVKDAAGMLGYKGTQRLKDRLISGELPSVRLGNRWHMPLSFVHMVLYSWRLGQPGSLAAIAERYNALAQARSAAAEAAAQAMAA
jgi:hypothetical protein